MVHRRLIMAAGTTARPKIANLAELLDRLGGVPLERIRFHPPPGTATIRDVVEIEARENRLCELVDGVLVEKPMGFTESHLAIVIGSALQKFVSENDLGIVTGESGMIRLLARLVRIPDVAFFAWDKFPDRQLPSAAVPRIAPDLAVEVLSASNTPAEMARKLGEYFGAGVRLVWVVDPEARIVTVHTSPKTSKRLTTADVLGGGRVLSGFQLPVAELFANLPARSKRKK
jgi:Uma2 family endonuclease